MDWYQFSLKRFPKLCVHRQHRWKKFYIWFSFGSSLCLAQIINFNSEILSGVHFMFRADSAGEHSLKKHFRLWYMFFFFYFVLFFTCLFYFCLLHLFCLYLSVVFGFVFFLIYGLRWVSSWNNLISGSYLLFLHFWSSFSLYCLFDDGQAFVELLLQLPSNWFKKINLLLKRVPTSHMRCDVPAWREWRTYLVLFFLSV